MERVVSSVRRLRGTLEHYRMILRKIPNPLELFSKLGNSSASQRVWLQYCIKHDTFSDSSPFVEIYCIFTTTPIRD